MSNQVNAGFDPAIPNDSSARSVHICLHALCTRYGPDESPAARAFLAHRLIERNQVIWPDRIGSSECVQSMRENRMHFGSNSWRLV
jgi:hypothetical protein